MTTAPDPIDAPLRPADLALHAGIGVPPELLRAAGVRRVTDAEARVLLSSRRSGDLAGVVYPYLSPDTGKPSAYRVRRDHPEIEAGKPTSKYLSSYGDRRRLYFPPEPSDLLADLGAPVIVVEAEKSVLAITAAASRTTRRVLAVATGGCWGWRGRIGKTEDASGARVDEKGPVPCFNTITWSGRDVVIIFDGDVASNTNIKAARRALTAELSTRGARVRLADVPPEDGVNGPDDYIGQHGDAAFFGLLDAATRADRVHKPAKAQQGREVIFEDPEPWPDAVDGDAIADGMGRMFSRYLALPSHASTALALWVLHAYCFEAWFTSPLLAITSPTKRCGKTLLLIVLGALVPRRLFAANVTAAALFRAIEKFNPVLLIDEADSFLSSSDELRGVLNSGHTRSTAVVIRAVGDDHDPRAFSTWCAKAIATIGTLPATLEDRAIEIAMRRRTTGERVERLRQDRIEGDCDHLKRQAARWALDNLDTLTTLDPTVPSALHDRAADCWRPLLAIADVLGGTWPTRAREAAVGLSGDASDGDDIAVQLLHDVRDVFNQMNTAFAPSTELVTALAAMDSRPWGDWRHGKAISTRAVADRLRPFGVSPGSNGTARGYWRDRFEDAWRRYPLVKVSTCQTPNKDGEKPVFLKCQSDRGADTLKSAVEPMNTGSIDTLTVSQGGDDDPATPGGVVEI